MSKPNKKVKVFDARLFGRLLVLGIVCVSVIGMFTFAMAGQSFKDLVASLVATNVTNELLSEDIVEPVETSVLLGASADYCDGTEATDNRCVMDIYDLTIGADGLTVGGPFTASATTTPSVNTYFSIIESLDLTGTSSAKGATQNIMAYYTNTGADLWLDYAAIDLFGELTAFEASVQCSTSTWVGGVEGGSLTGTTTAGLIASTTISSTFDVDDLSVLYPNMDVRPGASQIYASSSPILLDSGTVFFCSWTPYGATSSASFTSGGTFAGEGNMIANVRARGN